MVLKFFNLVLKEYFKVWKMTFKNVWEPWERFHQDSNVLEARAKAILDGWSRAGAKNFKMVEPEQKIGSGFQSPSLWGKPVVEITQRFFSGSNGPNKSFWSRSQKLLDFTDGARVKNLRCLEQEPEPDSEIWVPVSQARLTPWGGWGYCLLGFELELFDWLQQSFSDSATSKYRKTVETF